MKTKNILKSLLMSATLLMSGAMISCQADKDDDPVNFIAKISVDPENETANLGDTVHFTLDSNTDWTLVIANEKHQLLVEDALYSGKKGDGQDVWVKIASDLEEGSWVPGTKIELTYQVYSYMNGMKVARNALAYITVGESYSTGDHAGTADDPLSVKEAREKAAATGETPTSEKYYVKGVVKSVTEQFATKYGNGTFVMIDADNENDVFTAFQIKYFDNQLWQNGNLTVDVGDEIVVVGPIVNFKSNTPETASGNGYLYSLRGITAETDPTAPEDPEFEASDVTLPYTLDTTSKVLGTIDESNYAGNHELNIEGLLWGINGNTFISPWRIGGKSLDKVDRAVYTKQAIKENVAQIDITHGNVVDVTVNSFTVIVARDPVFKDVVSSLEQTFTANSTVTVSRPEGADWSNCYYKFLYNVTVTSNSNSYLQFSKVVFSDGQGGGTTEPEVPAGEDITPGEYYIFAKLATNSNNESLEPYIYHAWNGNITSGNDLETTSYSYDEGTSTFTVKSGASVYAAKITIEAVSGKENVYYIKYNDKYLYSTAAATNRKMALGSDASNAEWTFTKNANGGYSAKTNGVFLGSASATKDFLRSYSSESTLKYGVELFKTGDVTINNEGSGTIEPEVPTGEYIAPGEYYIFAKLETDSNKASLAPYIYHAWTGNMDSNDLETTSYSYDEAARTFTVKEGAGAYAAKINIEAVSGKENVYYIKYNDKYLYSTAAATNRKMALGSDASNAEWTFSNNAKGGYSAKTQSVFLGTASATKAFLRSYANESSLQYGVELFKTSDVTINNSEGGGTDPEEPGESNVEDVIDNAFTGVGTGTVYKDWTNTGKSGAVYSGQSAGDAGTIQMKQTGSTSGVVTTTSGGKVAKIKVKWNLDKTMAGRTLDVYAKNEPYTKAADLFNGNAGTKVLSISRGNEEEHTINGDYTYIGFRSVTGAMYLDSVTITWEPAE